MRYTEDQRKDYVRSWEQTEMSRKQFSKSNSLCYSSFLSWTKRYGEVQQSSFIKLEDSFSNGIKIVLPNGVSIQIDQKMSGTLLKMLLDV